MDPTAHAELRRRYEERRLQLIAPADPALLKELPLFALVPEKTRDALIKSLARYMHVVRYEPGDVVLDEGSYNDSAYYIIEGAAEVLALRGSDAAPPKVREGAHLAPPTIEPNAAAGRLIGRGGGTSGTIVLDALPADLLPDGRTILEAGEVFGEVSAISRYAVSASVKAVTPLKLLRIHLRALKTLKNPKVAPEFKDFLDRRYRERSLAEHLRQVGLFEGLDAALVEELKQRVELLSFEQGQVIVQEGAAADAFYLVRGGFVKVTVRQGSADLAVTYLRKGDHAGAAALLLEERWPFTLQALESVELIKLGRVEFQELLRGHAPLEDRLWQDTVARLKTRGAARRAPTSSEHLQMAMETGLIHGESVLLIDLSTCTRCDECVRGCADAHGGEPRFIREGQRYRNWLVPVACYQCTDPTCMIDCPTGAITREFGSLVVTINAVDHPTRPCIGCNNCAQRCPWGNIVMVERGTRPDGKPQEQATKCDLCHTRPEGPACVQMCPHGSAVRISFREVERLVDTLR